ncbi:hypothetical protein NC651_006448 [Populus alba x Populus x berolinensis]|nr:hypothetical protein NC651_006448 [Populus alba x Populus x berolinensis]
MLLHTPSMISLLPLRPALPSLRSISKRDGLVWGNLAGFSPMNMNKYHWGYLNQKHNSNLNQAEDARALLVRPLNADGSAEIEKVQKLGKEDCELIERKIENLSRKETTFCEMRCTGRKG